MAKRPTSSGVPERLEPGTLDWTLYYAEHAQRYEWAARYCRGNRFADVACGVGYGSTILRQHGAVSGVALDRDLGALVVARKLSPNSGVSRVAADAAHLPLRDRSVDTVVAFETIEHLSDAAVFIRECHRILAAGGVFLCSTPNREYERAPSREFNPYHHREYSFDEILELIGTETGFEDAQVSAQVPTDSFTRHLELVEVLARTQEVVIFSRLLKAEAWVRRLLGLRMWDLAPLTPALMRRLPSDSLIVAATSPQRSAETYLVACRKGA